MCNKRSKVTNLPVWTLAILAAPAMVVLAGCGDLQGSVDEQAGAITGAQITQVYTNASGSHQTFSTTPNPDPNNPFFQSLGTNGRACLNCHQPAAAWGITPPAVQAVFNSTNGTDPIFRLNDGSNAPNAPVATVAQRRAAYSMLLNRGVIRVGLPIPANAEFNLTTVEDPYHFASAAELSLFRRPLPSTNLKFLATVMWDGRETVAGAPINSDLLTQANDATRGHAQAARDLTAAERAAIVAFETAIFTAQITDRAAGSLTAAGATGGPVNLSNQAFHIGINDVLGADPAGTPFSTHVFSVYDAWANQSGSAQAAARASIARGQNIFNTRQFTISGVRGVNDAIGVPNLTGTCTTCHDTPNAGDHSVGLPLDLGLTDPNTFNTDTTPRYTLVNKTTGQVIRTSDPGRALIDGKWSHVATFKGPILRGLAPRPPYFHNGFAATLPDVVKFYDTRFHIGLNAQAATDLANFLAAL
jgi:cytochrome c peroxidase